MKIFYDLMLKIPKVVNSLWYITMPAPVQIQGGDPSGTGRGGECAWGGKAMLDEFSDHLRD